MTGVLPSYFGVPHATQKALAGHQVKFLMIKIRIKERGFKPRAPGGGEPSKDTRWQRKGMLTKEAINPCLRSAAYTGYSRSSLEPRFPPQDAGLLKGGLHTYFSCMLTISHWNNIPTFTQFWPTLPTLANGEKCLNYALPRTKRRERKKWLVRERMVFSLKREILWWRNSVSI